jgi:hypothetical protein
MASAALAVDLGMALVERRAVRNAADHAALAAAWADCNGRGPRAAADASILRNGFDIWDLTLSDTADGWEAVIDTTVGTTFAKVIGISSLDVSGAAVADCSGGGGTASAIFAFGDECDDVGKIQLNIAGSSNTVYGGVYSNDNVGLSGSSNNFGYDNPPVDPFEHFKPMLDPSMISANGFDTGYPLQVKNKVPRPDFIDIADYGPGGSAAMAAADDGKWFFTSGDWDKDEIIARGEGLYYARGDITVPEIDGEFTFVAEAHLRAPDGESTLKPYVDDLLFMGAHKWKETDKQCDSAVVALNGSNTNWTGIVYAPNGLIKLEGSTNKGFSGALLGWSVDLSGSEITIIADPNFFPSGGVPQLLE